MIINQNALDFLFENRLKDSREWFKEHKEIYTKSVQAPLYELACEIAPIINQIDSEIITDPKRVVSRIYRDTRFSKDKSIYRDSMWCTFARDKKKFPLMPAFFFEFSPIHYRYGCGFYSANTRIMKSMRNMIIDETPLFKSAQKMLDTQNIFSIQGELYKRNHYEEYSDSLCQWLNRKNIFISSNNREVKDILSGNLSKILCDGFESLTPLYEFFLAVYIQSDN